MPIDLRTKVLHAPSPPDATIGSWGEADLLRWLQGVNRASAGQLPSSSKQQVMDVHDTLIVRDKIQLSPQSRSTLPGAVIGYDQITTTVNITGTAEATPTTVIPGSTYIFDGAPVWAEFFSPSVNPPSVASQALIICLFEGATEICRWGDIRSASASFNANPITLRYRFTPSPGNHTYSIKAFASSVTGTPAVQAGAGGAATDMPAYLSFTKV